MSRLLLTRGLLASCPRRISPRQKGSIENRHNSVFQKLTAWWEAKKGSDNDLLLIRAAVRVYRIMLGLEEGDQSVLGRGD